MARTLKPASSKYLAKILLSFSGKYVAPTKLLAFTALSARTCPPETGQTKDGQGALRMRTFTGGTLVAGTFLALTALVPSTAAAEPVADFYRGKSISM